MKGLSEASQREPSDRVLADLRRCDLFRDLTDHQLARIRGCFEPIEIPAGHLVFQEGDLAEDLYLVGTGTVMVFRDAVGVPVQTLAHLRRGDFFGEMGLLCDIERSASVRATEPSRILKIHKQELFDVLDQHPDIKRRLQMTAAQRHSANMASTLELGRRREVRIRFRHRVTLELDDQETCSATLENLSLGGLCLRGAPESWEVARKVHFGLGLKVGMLPLAARVAWRRGDLSQGDTIGLSFQKMSSNHDKMIQMAIHLLLESSPLES